METIITSDLYKAAFYLCWGARIEKSEGSYPSSTFTLIIPRWKKKISDIVPFIHSKTFKKKRQFLKQASLSGKYLRNELGDNARVILEKRK